MGIVRDLYYARKMSAGLKLPAPTVALLIKRLRLAAAMGGNIEKTVSGAMVHITDALAKAALSVLVNITPTQDLHGYANPWPAGGGKQLFDPSKFIQNPISQSGIDVINNGDGTFTVKGTATGTIYTPLINYQYLSDYEFIEPNVSYTLSGYYNSNVYVGFGISGAGTDYWANTSGGRTMTFTAEDISAKKYRLVIRVNSGEVLGDTGIIIKPMICKSSASNPSTFAPYSNICPISGRTGLSVYVGPTQDQQDATTYAVDWTSEAGTVYGGTLDVVTGELTVDRSAFNAKTVYWSDAGSGRVYTSLPLSPTELTTPLCSHCEYHRRPAIGEYDNWIDWGGYPNSNQNLLVTLKGITDTLSQWNTYIQNNDVQLCYELATPITYQLSSQEVQMLLGENYVWSSSGDTVSVTYYAEGNANPLQSLNILLGGNYSNPKTADDVSDREALEIILGGNK